MAKLIKEKIVEKEEGYLYFVKKNPNNPRFLDLYKAKMGRGK